MQAVTAENKHKILTGQDIETERDENGMSVQIRHKTCAGAPGRVTVQAGQHVFHAGQAVAVTGQIIARRQGGRYFAAGKVVAGNAYGHDHTSGICGHGVSSPPPSKGAPSCAGRSRKNWR